MSLCFFRIPNYFVSFLVKNRSEILARRCSGNQHGIVRKYGLNMTRRDFREKAETMGWKKVICFRWCIFIPSAHIDFSPDVCSTDKRFFAVKDRRFQLKLGFS